MLFPVKKRMTNSILGLYDLQTPDLVDRGTVSFFHHEKGNRGPHGRSLAAFGTWKSRR